MRESRTIDISYCDLIRETLIQFSAVRAVERFDASLPGGGRVWIDPSDEDWRDWSAVRGAQAALLFSPSLNFGEELEAAKARLLEDVPPGQSLILHVETRTKLGPGSINYVDIGPLGAAFDGPTDGHELHESHVSTAASCFLAAQPETWSTSLRADIGARYISTPNATINLWRLDGGSPTLGHAGAVDQIFLDRLRTALNDAETHSPRALMLLEHSHTRATHDLEKFLFAWTAIEALVHHAYKEKYRDIFLQEAKSKGVDPIELLSGVPDYKSLPKGGIPYRYLAIVYVIEPANLLVRHQELKTLRDFRNEAFHEASLADLHARAIQAQGYMRTLLRRL